MECCLAFRQEFGLCTRTIQPIGRIAILCLSARMVVTAQAASGQRNGRIAVNANVAGGRDDPKTSLNVQVRIGDSLLMLMDEFWGDGFTVLDDPFGHKWSVSTAWKKRKQWR